MVPGQSTTEDLKESYANLKLCIYGAKESTVEKRFSCSTTLDELQLDMRKLFNIEADRETKLWINSAVYTFKPTTINNNNIVVSSTSNSSNGTLSPSKSENSIQSSTSPLKYPPTPPAMPSSNSSSNASTPTVVTRQAANSMNKPIALPDSSSSPTTRSSNLSTSTSDSPISSIVTKEDSSNQTLTGVGVIESAVATLEVINSDGTWPSSRPRYGTVSTRSSKAQPGLCGLSNMGNTCFMNSALQCLSNVPSLTNYILTDKFVDDINLNNALGMHGEIARTYGELIKVMWSGNNVSTLPREFKCAVSRFAPQFNGFAQQDCQELMAFLLDGLHEDLNRIRDKPYIETKNDTERRPDEVVAEESWSNYKKRNDSIVVDTFHGLLKSTLVCPGCKIVSVTFDPFCYLSLPLPVKREKQVNLTFLPAPGKISESKIKSALNNLDGEEIKTLRQYGASISSFNGHIEEHGGYDNPNNRAKACKMQVPRSGPVLEICDIVARVINEERHAETEKVKIEDLVVAELMTDGRLGKVYEPNDHYSQICDDIVVIEKKSTYMLPLYLRERKNKEPSGSFGTVFAKPLFLHVPDLKLDTLYKSIISSLSNLSEELHSESSAEMNLKNNRFRLVGSVDFLTKTAAQSTLDKMECDVANSNNTVESAGDGEDEENMDTGSDELIKTNGNSSKEIIDFDGDAFYVGMVNSFGTQLIETLGINRNECDHRSKLYLCATFTTAVSLHPQFAHTREPVRDTIMVETFTPKISPKPTLQLKDCITQFTNVERLGTNDPWYCSKCKKHQQATKKFDIWSLPKVMIIHLKRFSFSRSWRDKIDTLVEFPVKNLDMSEYVLNPAQKNAKKLTYDLIGVANHYGGLGGGHYTAYAMNSVQDSWYSFDDAMVTPTSSSNVVTRNAYVLFYQLQEEGQS